MNKNMILAGLMGLALFASTSIQALSLQDISFSSLPGDKTEMTLSFDGMPPEVSGYTIEEPARIALDMPGVTSALTQKYHKVGTGNARTAIVVGTNEKTRLILNLTKLSGYSTRVEGNNLVVLVGDQELSPTAQLNNEPKFKEKRSFKDNRVVDVDFRRGDKGEGNVQITLSNPNVPVDISQDAGRIRVEISDTQLASELKRRLDVIDFATPVKFIDATIEEGMPVFFIEPTGELYDYLAFQTNNILTISVKPLTPEEEDRIKEERFPYTGEKLSLNFQDIEVRTVLQIIADFTGFNLVASDSVQGNITLRLKNVPWDQALDIVLKSQGLAKQLIGNVLMVGPADQIANRQKIELEANKQVEEFAPIRTEFIQVLYAKASDILALIAADQGILSPRGSATVDNRTNKLMITDTAASIAAVRKAVKVIDIPVRQVLLEARIVVATTNVAENLGIRWGGGYGVLKNDNIITAGGNLDTVSRFNNNIVKDIAGEDREDVDLSEASMIDLPVIGPASTIAFGINNSDYLLDLELSAMESDGMAEVISQPRLITADGQKAVIKSGTQIPYAKATSSGATSIVFIDAVLKLEVTPHITADDRILVDLNLHKDAVGEIIGGVPSIDTNMVETRVLINNGETIVLGGVFQSEDVTQVEKTPFFGDLPVIGRLFRRTTVREDKSELLMFITPRLVKDVLSAR